jgi:hypothetical protein
VLVNRHLGCETVENRQAMQGPRVGRRMPPRCSG